VELRKKRLGATERDEEGRGAFRERLGSVDADRLVFVDESSTNVALTPRDKGGRPRAERAYGGRRPEEWGQENVTLISSITPEKGEWERRWASNDGHRRIVGDGLLRALYVREVLWPRASRPVR
jgi:hypothetical protein